MAQQAASVFVKSLRRRNDLEGTEPPRLRKGGLGDSDVTIFEYRNRWLGDLPMTYKSWGPR